MLVVGRRLKESITILSSDGPVVITILERKGSDGFRVGINAPREVKVVRTELLDNEQGEQE